MTLIKTPNSSFPSGVGPSSVGTAGLSVEVNCVHLEIQTYFEGFSIPLDGKMGISVLDHTGMGGRQPAKLTEESIGEARAIGILGTQSKGPKINGVSAASQ